MLYSKFVVLNLIKATVITLFIFSCTTSSKADEVDSLIQKLKDKDPVVRKEAAWALGKIKDPRAVEPLIAVLKDEDLRTRFGAAWALGNIKDARAVEPLIAVLNKDKELAVREGAAEALVKIGAPAVEPFIAALKDEDSYVRRRAARMLEKINDPRAVEPLIATAQEHLEVVAEAYIFFIRRGVPGAEAVLIKALKNHGTPEMAKDFLNCGNTQLSEAAREWAKRNDYMILPSLGDRRGPCWGCEK